MPGGSPDPLYVAARCVLLDALEAVGVHLDALVIVGAQAIYLHTGQGDLAIAPYTTDADLAIDPARLGPEPRIEVALAEAGFARERERVGIWTKTMAVAGVQRTVPVDFLVPESLGGPGRRGARIPPHDRGAARKVVGLEGVLVDRDRKLIRSLDHVDARSFEVAVGGPAALLVAKTHKLLERLDRPDRRSDKDALDVLRLLRAVPTDDLLRRLQTLLTDSLSSEVTGQAMEGIGQLFGYPSAPGSRMAARAAAGSEPGDVVAASLTALANDLIRAVEAGG
jgi:hypothetical protein